MVWEFYARDNCQEAFEAMYGSRGDWATLFQKSPGYRNTQLFQDVDQRNRYLVVDTWDSRAAYEAFKTEYQAEYDALDRQCERLTDDEAPFGSFLRD